MANPNFIGTGLGGSTPADPWAVLDPSLGTVADPNSLAGGGMALAAGGSTVESAPNVGSTDTLDGYSNLQSIGAIPADMTKLTLRTEVLVPPTADPGNSHAYFQLAACPSAAQVNLEGFVGGVSRTYDNKNQVTWCSQMGGALASSNDLSGAPHIIELCIYFVRGTTTARFATVSVMDAGTVVVVNNKKVVSAGSWADVFLGFSLTRGGTPTNDIPWGIGPIEWMWS